jgi:hypothetical protein
MAVAIAAFVVALGGVAVASPIGGDGKVYLCFDQEGMDTLESGAVRAVKAGSPCPDGFTSFVLDQTGPAGAPGPVGAPGPAGMPGPQGAGGKDPKLDAKTAQDALKQLEKADKIAEKNDDKLRKLEAAIKESKEDATKRDDIALWLKQQRMAEMMQQITDAITQVTKANQQIVKHLR